VAELLLKDVTHGFTIPLPLECAPQIKGAMIQPLGVVKQWSLNENNERVAKFRLDAGSVFPFDPQRSLGERKSQSSTIPGNGVRLVHAPYTTHSSFSARTVPRARRYSSANMTTAMPTDE
jgi:hypothetical protein